MGIHAQNTDSNEFQVSGTGTNGQVLTATGTSSGVTSATWQAGGSSAVTSVAGRTGAVTLTESDVASLTTDLAAKAPLASPALTGTPTAPTATAGTNTTQVATTAYVLANGGTPADASATVKGIVELNTDLGGTAAAPQVVATHLAAALPLAQGGTGSTTQNFVDLTTAQTVAGAKTLTGNLTVSKSVPEQRLISNDSNYTRVNRADTGDTVTRYNQVMKPAGSNYALSLSGTGQGVTIPYVSIGANYSYAFWFQWTSGSDLFSYQNQLIRVSGTGFTYWPNVNTTSYTISATVSTGAWHSFVLTQNGSTTNVWLDGTQIATNLATNAAGVGNSNGGLGSYSGSSSTVAIFDELRIYSSAISSTAAGNYYNSGSGSYGASSETGLTYGYHLDDGTGVAPVDYSGNANTATLIGTPTAVTGKVTQSSSTVEAQVWSSTDGVAASEAGIHTFGDAAGGTKLQGQTVKTYTNGVLRTQVNNSGVFLPFQATTAAAPAYVKGGMYFDTTLNKLRIGGATAWETITSS